MCKLPVNEDASFSEHKKPQVHERVARVHRGETVVHQHAPVGQPQSGEHQSDHHQHLHHLR